MKRILLGILAACFLPLCLAPASWAAVMRDAERIEDLGRVVASLQEQVDEIRAQLGSDTPPRDEARDRGTTREKALPVDAPESIGKISDDHPPRYNEST